MFPCFVGDQHRNFSCLEKIWNPNWCGIIVLMFLMAIKWGVPLISADPSTDCCPPIFLVGFLFSMVNLHEFPFLLLKYSYIFHDSTSLQDPPFSAMKNGADQAVSKEVLLESIKHVASTVEPWSPEAQLGADVVYFKTFWSLAMDITTDWWFGTWILWLSIIYGIIIPTDQYFSEALKPPTSFI